MSSVLVAESNRACRYGACVLLQPAASGGAPWNLNFAHAFLLPFRCLRVYRLIEISTPSDMARMLRQAMSQATTGAVMFRVLVEASPACQAVDLCGPLWTCLPLLCSRRTRGIFTQRSPTMWLPGPWITPASVTAPTDLRGLSPLHFLCQNEKWQFGKQSGSSGSTIHHTWRFGRKCGGTSSPEFPRCHVCMIATRYPIPSLARPSLDSRGIPRLRSSVESRSLYVGISPSARVIGWLEQVGPSRHLDETVVFLACIQRREGICITAKGLRHLTTGKVSGGRTPSLRGSIHDCTTRIAEM